MIPGSEEPITVFREKEFANDCCLIDGGYVTLKLQLPRSCYTSGQCIPITAEIENHSDRTITSTLARLVFDERYNESKQKSINNTNIILTRYCGKIKGGNSDTWSELPLCSSSMKTTCFTTKTEWTQCSAIPPLPQSTVQHWNYCTTIQCFYYLQFQVLVRGFSRPFISIDIPLTIGTIPHHHVANDPKVVQSEFGGRKIELSAPLCSTTNKIDDFPPPSYSEATTMVGLTSNISPRPSDTKDTHANWDFKPKYLIWNTNSS